MKLAIIGASFGQIALYKRAKELGHEVIGFAWNKGLVRECLDCADRFYPISVVDTDRIVEICRKEHVDGVVSNGSELLAQVVAQVSSALGLNGNDPMTIYLAQDKLRMREMTNNIPELKCVECRLDSDFDTHAVFPCVVKPLSGSGKSGVSFVCSRKELSKALEYAKASNDNPAIIEEYLDGQEVSVESMSYKGRHWVIQITDKVSTGAPHFIEIAHHQPSMISVVAKLKINHVVPLILNKIGFKNGAAHIEFKVLKNDEVALIEVNPRGGGGEISSTLVGLSTDYDYVGAMIDVALDRFLDREVKQVAHAGIFFLCAQTANWSRAFERAEEYEWFVRKKIVARVLHEATGNADRCGYLIYRSTERVIL